MIAFGFLQASLSDSILDTFHKEIHLSDAILFTRLLTPVVFVKGIIYPQHCFVVENVEEINPKKDENSYGAISALSSRAVYLAEEETPNPFKPGFSLPLLPLCQVSFCRKLL